MQLAAAAAAAAELQSKRRRRKAEDAQSIVPSMSATSRAACDCGAL